MNHGSNLPSIPSLFSLNLLTGSPSTNRSASASTAFATAVIRSSRSLKFCNRFTSIMLFPSLTRSCSTRNFTTLSWNPEPAGKIRFTIPACCSSSTDNFVPNMRNSFVRWTPICDANVTAEPCSGTRPSAENGVCRYAPSAAKTRSATPGNQAAPPPTPGPFRARTRILVWSMSWRRSSKLGVKFVR